MSDFTLINRAFNKGVFDFSRYFADHPDELETAINEDSMRDENGNPIDPAPFKYNTDKYYQQCRDFTI